MIEAIEGREAEEFEGERRVLQKVVEEHVDVSARLIEQVIWRGVDDDDRVYCMIGIEVD